MRANHVTPICGNGLERAVCWPGCYISGVVAVMLCASCGLDQEVRNIKFEALSVSPIEGQKSDDRVLDVATLRKLIELPATPSKVVMAPAGLFADIMGYIYVVDEWDYRIHRFASSGNYVTSYGEGQGTGPGEFMGIWNFGVLGDSTVCVFEHMTHEVSYFDVDGSLLRSERLAGSMREYPDQYVFTREGRLYSKFSLQENIDEELFESRLGGDVV